MNQSTLTLIQTKVKEIRVYLDNFEPPLAHLNDSTLSTKEVWDLYANVVNENSKFQVLKKDLEFIIYTLTDAKQSVSQNTPSGQKIINQLNGQLQSLQALRKALEPIDTIFYYTLRYYEKGGGSI